MALTNPPAQKEYPRLLRAKDIQERLGISETAAYRLMRESLPVIKIGPGTLRVREIDLEQFIEKNRDDHRGDSS